MITPDDTSLLNAWVHDGSEEAFGVLARRYAGLLYHAGLRQTGSPELAQEAAQNTLSILARKAAGVHATPSLAPWLHRTACFEASQLLRRERRHCARMKAYIPPDNDPDPWARVAPLLDAALNDLPESDRRVLLMKYVDGWTFEQMSARLGGEPAAWRKRGSRAVEQLRRIFAGKGVVVPVAVISGGLNATLTQSAPAAITAALGASPLAAASSLTWKTLTLHSLYLMKIKQTAIAAGIVLAALIPLGLQYRSNAEARDRLAVLTNSLEAQRTAPAQASETARIARAGDGSAPAAVSTKSAVPDNIDLAEWAELLSKREPTSTAEMTKMLSIRNTIGSLDAAAVERLMAEAEKMSLPPAKRMGLITALLSQLTLKAPSTAVQIAVRMSAAATNEDNLNLNFQAGAAMGLWVSKDPEAAEAWFAKAKADGAFETKRLSNVMSLESTLQQHRIAGLLRSRPDLAEKVIPTVAPQDAANGLSLAVKTLDPALVLRLAKLLPPGHQPSAIAGAMRHLADTDPAGAAQMARSIDVNDETKRSLLAEVATSISLKDDGKPDWTIVKGQSAWLRQEVPQGQTEEAVGIFLAGLGRYDLAHAMEAYRQETAGQSPPDPMLTRAFVSVLGRTGKAHFKEAMPLAEAMPAGEERDRALRELGELQWSKDGRTITIESSYRKAPAPVSKP